MAVTTTTTVNLELTYDDYTTRNYKIPLRTGTTTSTVKTAITAFNTAAGDANSSVAQTFISEGEAKVGGITNAIIVEKQEEEIYHA